MVLIFRAMLDIGLLLLPSVGWAAVWWDYPRNARFVNVARPNSTSPPRGAVNLECRPGEILIGVKGWYDAWLIELHPRCRQFNKDGAWTGRTRTIPPPSPAKLIDKGTTIEGARSFVRACSPKHAVVGLTVRYGSQYLQKVRLTCSRLLPDGRVKKIGTYGRWGGPTKYRDPRPPRVARISLPNRFPAMGLTYMKGKTGKRIRGIGLRYTWSLPGGVVNVCCTGNELFYKKHPVFTWRIHSDGLTQYVKVCVGVFNRTVECTGQLSRTTTRYQPRRSMTSVSNFGREGKGRWVSFDSCNSIGCTKMTLGDPRGERPLIGGVTKPRPRRSHPR